MTLFPAAGWTVARVAGCGARRRTTLSSSCSVYFTSVLRSFGTSSQYNVLNIYIAQYNTQFTCI